MKRWHQVGAGAGIGMLALSLAACASGDTDEAAEGSEASQVEDADGTEDTQNTEGTDNGSEASEGTDGDDGDKVTDSAGEQAHPPSEDDTGSGSSTDDTEDDAGSGSGSGGSDDDDADSTDDDDDDDSDADEEEFDPDLEEIAELSNAFFEDAADAGMEPEWIAGMEDDSDDMDAISAQYDDLVEEYFHVSSGDRNDEYVITLTAAFFGMDPSDLSGNSPLFTDDEGEALEMGHPEVFEDLIDVEEDDEYVVAHGVLIDFTRALDPDLEDEDDEDIAEDVYDSGGTIPLVFEEEGGEWKINAAKTVDYL